MVAFIKQHGQEEVQRIEKEMESAFTIQKNKYVDNEKTKIIESLQNDLANREVKMKIEKSKEQNERRIERMRKVNEFIDQLNGETRMKIKENFENDSDSYKQLCKSLLLQGLIKLMEAKVVIRCREQDVSIIEEVIEEAVNDYKQMMIDEVKLFEGKSPDEIPCEVRIDTNKYLPSIDDDEKAGCIGGFKLLAKRGKIVLS